MASQALQGFRDVYSEIGKLECGDLCDHAGSFRVACEHDLILHGSRSAHGHIPLGGLHGIKLEPREKGEPGARSSLDVLHRAGNAHGSRGAQAFATSYLGHAGEAWSPIL